MISQDTRLYVLQQQSENAFKLNLDADLVNLSGFEAWGMEEWYFLHLLTLGQARFW